MVWVGALDTYGWKLIASPPSTQSKNGLSERAVRSLKVDGRSIFLTESRPIIEQRILALSSIAKNHAPRSIDCVLAAMAMFGRCDILSGYASYAFDRNPESTEPVARPTNFARNIMSARNAAIRTDSNRAIHTCIDRKIKRSASICLRGRYYCPNRT